MATASSDKTPAHYGDRKESNEYNNVDAMRTVSPFEDANASYIGDYQPGSEEEKKLLRKLDMRIIVRRSINQNCGRTNNV